MECLFNQNKHKKLLINDNDAEWLSDLIGCLQFFYQMTVKISGQNYVTCSFIIPCLKSLQVAMGLYVKMLMIIRNLKYK